MRIPYRNSQRPEQKLQSQENSANDRSNMELFKSRSHMSDFWSIIIFLFNVWTVLTTFFWASLHQLPTGIGPLFHIFIECVLFFEVIVRIFIKVFLKEAYESLHLQHVEKNDGFRIYSLLIVGSFPMITLYTGLNDPEQASDSASLFSKLILLKLLRSFEIKRAISKVEEILFYKNFKTLVFVKFVKNLMIIVLVTHFFTCWWLFIESSVSNHPLIKGTSSSNPYATDKPYLERAHKENASLFEKYIDACLWAVGTLTACSFPDVTPRTLEEFILSLITLLAGVFLLAMIFSDFASLMYLLDIERGIATKHLQEALKLCEILGIPFKIRYKIQAFYTHDNHSFSQTQYLSAIKDLPQSLHTDIVLSLNKDTVGKVNLFNFGSPDLLLSIARMMYPKVGMPGDYILRIGEAAEEMYFIKQGEVEVLATDNKTRIAILREGAYFGEIGLLLTQKRTVTIRALTICVFEVLHKNDFDKILENHPEQKRLLLQVAQQRIKVCSPQDIKPENMLQNESRDEISGVFDSAGVYEVKEPNASPRIKKTKLPKTSRLEIIWRKIVQNFKNYACMNKDIDFTELESLVILPISTFSYIWAGVLGMSIIANQIIVPYEISFGEDHESMPVYWRVIDIILVVIHFFDILIHMNTSVKKRGVYIFKKDYITKKYFSEKFAIDLLAFIPIDYIMLALHLPRTYSYWIKLLRFLKFPRFLKMLLLLRDNSEKKKSSSLIVILAVFHVSLNHIAACIMHMIATYELKNYSGNTLLKKLVTTNKLDMPLDDQSPAVQYTYFIYWACSVSSAGAYGDIEGVTPFEKIFEIVTLLFFKVYFTLIAAEVARIFTSAYTSFKESLDKTAMYEKWMTHIKLPKDLVARVHRYNDYVFQKYKGLDQKKILSELPTTTSSEILDYVLESLLDAVEIFPKEEAGLYSYVAKAFEIKLFTKDEYIFKAGETAEEMYFILEGEVVIKSEDDKKDVAYVKKNGFFGEISIITGKVSTRIKNAQAKTDVMLAILQLPAIKDLWKKYPTVKTKMLRVVERKRRQNEELYNINIDGVDWFLKDLDDEIKPQSIGVNLFSQSMIAGKDLLSPAKDENGSELERLKKGGEASQELNISQLVKAQSTGSKKMDATPGGGLSSFDNDAAQLTNNNLRASLPRNSWDLSLVQRRSLSRLSSSHLEVQNLRKKLEGRIENDVICLPDNIEKKAEPSLQYFSEAKLDGENKGSGSFGNVNKSFYLSRDLESSKETVNPKKHPPKPKSKVIAFLLKLEAHFKEIRPLILNLILFFDVMFAPANMALEIAHSGPLVYLELTLAAILVVNFLLNLKDLIKGRKNEKKVFMGALALSALGWKSIHHKQGKSLQGVEEKEDHKSNYYQHADQNKAVQHENDHHDGDHHEGGHGGHGGHGEHGDHEVTIVTVCLDFIFMVPFTIVFHFFHVPGASTNIFLIALQLVKLCAVEHLTWIFQREFFKKRYAVGNIFVIMYAFFIMNHIIACLFIILANAKEDLSATWYIKVPAPQHDYPNITRHITKEDLGVDKFTIYIHSLYWSYMTTSNIGVGDVSAVNADEKIFASVVILISTFLKSFLFGNLASMVDDLTPKFQKEYQNNYRNVLKYVKVSKLDAFLEKIHKYYHYIWQDNKGVDENSLLQTLPNSLRYDIIHNRYKSVFEEARLFKDQNGNFDYRIFYSFCKKFRCEYFMENDMIVTIGQEVQDVYLILEGEAEVIDNNISVKTITKLLPGHHLGGIIAKICQFQNIKATNIVKVAILPQEDFQHLKEAFPEWYNCLLKEEAIYKCMQRSIKIFNGLLERAKNRKLGIGGEGEKNVSEKNRSQLEIVQEKEESSQVNKDINIDPQKNDSDTEEPTKKKVFDQKRQSIIRDKKQMQASVQLTGLSSSDAISPLKIQTKNTIPYSGVQATPRLMTSPKNETNLLPPGDKEPLEDYGIVNKGNNNAWLELVEPLESPNGDSEAPSKPVDENSPSRSPSPIFSLAAVENQRKKTSNQEINISPRDMIQGGKDKYASKRASIFKSEGEGPKPEEEEEMEEKKWYTPIVNIFNKITGRTNKKISKQIMLMHMPSLQKNSSSKTPKSKGARKSVVGSIFSGNGVGSSQTLTNKFTMKAPSDNPGSGTFHGPSFLIQEDQRYDEENSQVEDQVAESQQLEPNKKRIKKVMAKSSIKKYKNKRFGPTIAEIIRERKKMDEHVKSLKYYIDPTSRYKTIYELVHTLMIIYTAFAVPIYFGFGIELGWGCLLLEFLVFLEMIAYPAFLVRTAEYSDGILKPQSKQVWQRFLEKNKFRYLFALIPFNLILSMFNMHPPLTIDGILRMNRMVMVFSIGSQFAFFGSKYPQITRVLNIFKPTFYLACISHFIACLFSWALLIQPNTDLTLIKVLELNDASLGLRYILSLEFMLSIATTTGYPELIVYNNFERVAVIFLVYLGDAAFALVLGWYTSNSAPLPEKYNYVFEKILKMEYILDEKRVPNKIRKKIENYFAYIVNTRNSNKSCLESLSGLLPSTILKDMASEQAKDFQRFPLFKEFPNKVLTKEIIKHLQQRIYLPHDYIITKNDYGSEMYCIAEGTVHMLSPNEKKVLAVLHTGAFFGELGLYTTTKRLTSFVAASFCLIYILEKDTIKKILKSFPQSDFDFEAFALKKLSYSVGNGKSSVSARRMRVQKAVEYLQTASNSTEATTNATKLLKASEIPRYVLKAEEKLKKSARGGEQGLQISTRPKNNQEENDEVAGTDEANLSLGSLLDDYVEDEEMNHRTLDFKKNSFRVKTRKRERRFSRLQMGREKSVSKSEGLTIRWGINLN